MSARNVVLARRALEAMNAPRDIEALIASAVPNIEFHSTFAAVGGAVYHGPDGLRQWDRDLDDAWEEIHNAPEVLFDLGEHTLAFGVLHGRGRHSGVQAAMPVAHVFRWTQERLAYCKVYAYREDALRSGSFKGRAGADCAMTTSSNLDLVRSICAGWACGDYRSAEWADPEIEFVIVDGPSPGRWTGLAGVAEGFRDWLSAWEAYRVEADEYHELDNERVLALVRNVGRGKTSGLELAQLRSNGAGVFHVRGGKVTRYVIYWDRDRALAELGLASEADSP